MFNGFFTMFNNNSGQEPMSEKDKEIIEAFAEAERMYQDIMQKRSKGDVTVDVINAALAQLKKGAGAPDAGSAPTGKGFKYSKELRKVMKDIEKKSKPPKNNGM